jgi:asparagine synthase (glutamine-hydrolysing)
MCGICGELRFDRGAVEPATIVAMRDRLIHRGPDAAGLYLSPDRSAGLGFRRLKIIDLTEQASQPLSNEDGSIQVVFNGEIYNFRELRRDLIANGHTFRSHSDTEVIAHLYEEHGGSCVDKLDGMFAIGIWDERSQRLLLARDRVGKKPLFYLQNKARLVFASEIKAFFGRPDLDMRIDPLAIPHYFTYGYVPCPQTFYRSVHQLEPGTVLTVGRDGKTSTRKYWRLHYPAEEVVRRSNFDRRQVISKVQELTTAAVERRLISDVPLGAFLSGGVDSTIIVGLMSRLLDRPVQTFSIGFKDSPGYDETAFARIAAKRFNTDHTEFIVEPGDVDQIEKLVWHHDGPFGDSSAVPTFIVSQLTRQEVTVVLTGDGGDELFAGYQRFAAALAAERMPRALRASLRAVSSRLPASPDQRHWAARVKRFANSASLPLEERITSWSALFYDDAEKLLLPDLLRAVGPIDRLQYIRPFQEEMEGLSTLSRLLTINFNTYLLNDLLVKTDRCTMANSLEARSPFLDTALVDFIATLPDFMKLAHGRTKIILREAFRDLIPPEIQHRPKMGFGVPFGRWFRGALRDAVHDTLLSPNARYAEYLSASYVHSIVRRNDTGEADMGLSLWSLLTFEIWLQALHRWNEETVITAASPF